MSHLNKRSVAINGLMDKFLVCQFIEEDEKENCLDLELGRTTTTTPIVETQGGMRESMPVRRRSSAATPMVPKPIAGTIKTMIPSAHSNSTSTTAVNVNVNVNVNVKPPPPFFPPPPPMFATRRNAGPSSSSSSPLSPAFLVDPSTGASFHPDFMFCGVCTDCKEDEDNTEVSTPIQTNCRIHDNGDGNANEAGFDFNFNFNSNENENENKAFLQTSYRLYKSQRDKDSSSKTSQHYEEEALILQSLIEAIPGVEKASIPAAAAHTTNNTNTNTNISSSALDSEHAIVTHDASVQTESILHALQQAGYSASVRGTTTTTTATNAKSVVTSASTSASASASASASTSSTKTNAAVEDETSWVRSSFNVGGICCASEIFSIRKILSPLPGVQSVKVNVTTKIVLVGHRYDRIQASQIARSLTKEGFPAQIQRDGAKFDNSGIGKEKGQLQSAEAVAELLKGIQKSTFVESTLTLEGLRPNQIQSIEKAVADSFISHQVRAVYPSVISETIKVEHDPDLVTITEIRDVLRNYAVNKGGPRSFPPAVEVYINGADANLYLPCEKDYPNQPMIHRKEVGYVSWLKSRHVNVWLSGFFWILSMIRLADGKDQFKYFGLASVFFGLPPIMVKAYRTLRRCQFDANCMMVTAALGALALGEYDEAASVSFLFAVSEFLESSAAMKARKALSEICALRPDHANVIHPISKEIVVVPADRVPLGSTISVRTGDKIAADGVVVEGTTSVDESSLTGESTPVPKTIGDEVSGGTINIGQTQLVIKTKTTVEDSAVSKLIRLVEEAQSNPSPTENMVDSFARSYTPFVIVIAAFMCTIPWCFGTEIGRNWTMKGLIIVVIACPCALTISTPVTYAAGLAATAKRGVIIKGGAKLEAMGSVDRVVFDKTGTLTKGKFSVTHMEVIGNYKTRQEMLELLSLMQDRASHPIASSLVHAAKSEGVNIPRQMAISDHEILEGEGIAAKVDGQVQVYVGNQRLFKRLGLFQLLSTTNKNIVEEWEDTGGTVGFIGTNKQIIGMFCVKDSVREEAKEALQELEEAQIETFMCTGDSNTTAQAVAKEIGIPNHRVNSQLLPQDKLDFVKTLRRPEPKKFALCQKKQYVLFCGDGVNDAPALAGVHISVSMGGGAAMALELSDVTLMDSRLTKLPYVIKMGQRVLTTVKENIILSFVAKFAVILLTFMGKMTLLYAIASDVGIMLLVTLNGMKLLPNDDYDPVEPEQNRRGRTIGNRLNFLGKNAGYELVRIRPSKSASDSKGPFEPCVPEII